jgi:hypothetical protein
MSTNYTLEQMLSRICGSLEAFAQLNSYADNTNSYCFIKVEYNDDLSKSIKQYFEDLIDGVRKNYPDIKFCNKIPIRNLFNKE